MLRCNGDVNVTECVVSTTIRNTRFHWLNHNLKRSRQEVTRTCVYGVALDPFTSNKNKWRVRWNANFNKIDIKREGFTNLSIIPVIDDEIELSHCSLVYLIHVFNSHAQNYKDIYLDYFCQGTYVKRSLFHCTWKILSCCQLVIFLLKCCIRCNF